MEAADDLNISNATDKLEAIQSELFCGICHDFFVQAFTLSCSHSFCFECITAWRVNHVDCPVCRRETVGMAPSRALDNMVAALNGAGSDTSLNNTSNCQSNRNVSAWFNTPQNFTNGNLMEHDNAQGGESDDGTFFDSDDEEVETDYLDYDSDYFEDEEEEEGYEDEVEEDVYEEEEDVYEDEESYISDSDEDDEEDEDYNDEEYYAHSKRSNQSNPNNNEYWQIRGYACRPPNWRELSRIGKH